jgi:hypothetical protein
MVVTAGVAVAIAVLLPLVIVPDGGATTDQLYVEAGVVSVKVIGVTPSVVSFTGMIVIFAIGKPFTVIEPFAVATPQPPVVVTV